MNGWNYIRLKEDGSVEGALPEHGQTVLVMLENGTAMPEEFYIDEQGPFFEMHDVEEVRAWMPMPKPCRPRDDRSHILRAVGRYIQTQAEENGLSALGVNGIVYDVKEVLQELDALIREEEGET